MVKRFPSLQNKCDAFDRVVSEVLADLRSTNNSSGEWSRRGDTSIYEGYEPRSAVGNAPSLVREIENLSLARDRTIWSHSAANSPAVIMQCKVVPLLMWEILHILVSRPFFARISMMGCLFFWRGVRIRINILRRLGYRNDNMRHLNYSMTWDSYKGCVGPSVIQ